MRTRLSAGQLTPLIEIIIAVAFFAGTSTILVQVFAKAYNDSRFAHDVNNATLFVSECIERVRTSDSYDNIVNELLLIGFDKDDNERVFTITLDDGFSPVSEEGAYSAVTLVLIKEDNEAGSLITGRFTSTRRDGRELALMNTAKFIPGAADAEP